MCLRTRLILNDTCMKSQGKTHFELLCNKKVWTDGQTDKVLIIGLPHLWWRGPKKFDLLAWKSLTFLAKQEVVDGWLFVTDTRKLWERVTVSTTPPFPSPTHPTTWMVYTWLTWQPWEGSTESATIYTGICLLPPPPPKKKPHHHQTNGLYMTYLTTLGGKYRICHDLHKYLPWSTTLS